MSLSTSVGVGYRHSTLDRRLRTMGAANVVTRLTSHSITGHALPMEMHQHYGFEFHLLTDTSCIRRDFNTAGAMRRICAQLERGLEGLCSCVFDAERLLSLADKVEQCLRAHPVPCLGCRICGCEECTDYIREISDLVRWICKNRQRALYSRSEFCSCGRGHVESMN